MLIDRLEKGILNTDFADWTDSFFFGLKGMKRRMVSCTICSSYETVVRLHPNAQLRHVKFEVVHAKTIQKKMQILNTLPVRGEVSAWNFLIKNYQISCRKNCGFWTPYLTGGGWHVRLLDINYHAGKKRILNSLTVGTIQYDNSI